jgi:hypothetical protein
MARLWKHGRDHLPGGRDPIPGLSVGGSGDYMFPSVQGTDLIIGKDLRYSTQLYRAHTDTATYATPTRSFLNNFNENVFASSSRTATNGDFTVFPFTLGPTGSIWGFEIGFITGPDFGNPTLSIAKPADTSGSLAAADGLTYIQPTGSVSVNGYTAAVAADLTSLMFIKIGGDTGDALTAFSAGTGIVQGVTDGGPGVYNLKVAVSGKHASSTGYKIGLWAVTASRLDANDYMG